MDRQYWKILENLLLEALNTIDCQDKFLAFAGKVWEAKEGFPNLSKDDQERTIDSLYREIHPDD